MRYLNLNDIILRKSQKIKLLIILLTFIAFSRQVAQSNANEESNIYGTGRKQISDINLLLPISTCQDCRKATYNISALNGCYEWDVSHKNMIQIKQFRAPQHPECANIAQVTPLSIQESKAIVWISAKDRNTGQVLRCEAKLSKITRIDILTHLRQFYVDDYQYLQIIGYDEEGNVFNSLEGLRFEWSIREGTDIVRIATLNEAAQKSSDIKRNMELLKFHSDVLFLKGLKTGSATIQVSINEPGYEHIPLNFVKLTITEPFAIIPSNTVYLLPTTQFKFKLAKITLKNHNMSYHNIDLPNSQYQWNLIDDQGTNAENHGMIGEDGVFISKDKEGFVRVIVNDIRITNNTAESSVQIVFPHMLDVEIADITDQYKGQQLAQLTEDLNKPYSEQLSISSWDENWILVKDHYYMVKIFLYDKDKNKITLTDNLRFKTILPDEFFNVIKSNKIGSEQIIQAKKVTLPNQKITISSLLLEIQSALKPYIFNIDQNRIRSEKDVKITQPISIQHPTKLVLLPYIKRSEESQNGEIWQLKAIGGSGYYIWNIESDLVASISGTGLLRSKQVGFTKVIVRDNMNKRNYDTINVEVSPIQSLTWLEDHLEIEKNQTDILNVVALDRQNRRFTNCTSINPSIEVKGEGILTHIPIDHSYENIKHYVQDHKELIFLGQWFSDNPAALVYDKISTKQLYSQEQEDIILHNNFGICSQEMIKAVGEGLARVRSYITMIETTQNTKFIESNYAEIAAYNKLQTIQPNYLNFFSDLQSQTSTEDHTYDKMHEQGVFDLAFGTSIQWIISGGTNFWKDFTEKYQVNHSKYLLNQDEGSLDSDVLRFDRVSQSTTLFQYQLTCQGPRDRSKMSRPHRFRVYLKQQNLISRQLLRPALHELTIDIYCEPPAQQKLYWAQEKTQLTTLQQKNLPKYKMITREKIHYALVNSDHYIRALMFDHQNSVFFNYSSINNEVKSSNERMLSIYPLNETYLQEVQSNVYYKKRIHIHDITGTVYIQAKAQGYYRGFLDETYSRLNSLEPLHLNYEVKDEMRVEIVKNIDIQPKYKSLYLTSKDNSFSFKINHGSGHFIVNINNTDLAEMNHKENIITLYPKKEGSLEIRVEDAEIPDSQPTIAEFLISDISKLELDAPGYLIEQGSHMELYVTAYDKYGQEFDQDQYQFMEFYIDIENIGVKRAKELSTSYDSSDNRKFIAHGNEPGTYQVTAFTYKYNDKVHRSPQKKRITSDMLKIEVFPLLEIHPTTLLLTPQMRYTLQIVGGPSRSTSQNTGSVEIKFDIDDKSIASVDVFREVIGKEVGDTNMFYEIIQLKQGKTGGERRSIVSKKTIPIRVRLVTDIEIPYNNQRLIYSTSMIKMNAILKYNQETFTQGIAPISYSWNCSNPNILALQQPNKQDSSVSPTVSNLYMVTKKIRDNAKNNNNAIFFSQFNSSSIYGLANQQGESLIHLELAIEYPEKYRLEKNWFETNIIVRVNEKLTVEVPEFINKPEKETHLYLMPPNTYSKIETNKKTRLRLGYSLQSVYDYATGHYKLTESTSPMIQLVNDEGIRTLDKYGKVTIIIEENQAFSDQVVMLNLLITDIFNIVSKDVYQALSLPLGSTMKIPIKFQNEHAHLFANNIEGIDVGFELSHPRVVTGILDEYNQTVILQAQGNGECNVVIYLIKNPNIYDVFKVRVSSVVKPNSPVQLHLGGQVTFKIMESTSYAQGSQDSIWSSGNPSIIDINQKTGEASALSEGKADILLSNHISAASIVHVSKVRNAQVDEKSRTSLVINTDDRKSDLRIRIKLFLQDQIEELTPTVQFDGITLIRQNVGIICESEHPQYIQANAEINDIEGFFCVLNYVQNAPIKNVPKSSQIYVTAYAINPRDNKSFLYKERVLQFEVAIVSKIKVESAYRQGIHLNRNQRTAEIKIYSNIPFSSLIENEEQEDKGYELIKHRLARSDDTSNEFVLSLSVPREITHDFKSKIILTHPTTGQKTAIPISFSAQEGYYQRRATSSEDEEEEGEGFFERISNVFTPKQRRVPTNATDRHDLGETKGRRSTRSGIIHVIIAVFFGVIVLLFFFTAILKIDPNDIWVAIRERRLPRAEAQVQRRPTVGIREPILRNVMQNAPNQAIFSKSPQSSGIQGASVPNFLNFPYSQQNSRVRENERDISRSSMYQSPPRRKIL